MRFVLSPLICMPFNVVCETQGHLREERQMLGRKTRLGFPSLKGLFLSVPSVAMAVPSAVVSQVKFKILL